MGGVRAPSCNCGSRRFSPCSGATSPTRYNLPECPSLDNLHASFRAFHLPRQRLLPSSPPARRPPLPCRTPTGNLSPLRHPRDNLTSGFRPCLAWRSCGPAERRSPPGQVQRASRRLSGGVSLCHLESSRVLHKCPVAPRLWFIPNVD